MLKNNPFYYGYNKKELRSLCVNPHADLDKLDKNNTLKLWSLARFRKEISKMIASGSAPFTHEEIFSKMYTKADLPPEWCKYILTNILKEEKKF